MNADAVTIVFLGNGRCYHTMDWFRSAQRLRPEAPPILITDLIEGESFPKLIRSDDRVLSLFLLDKLLLDRQSRPGDIWRNVLKLLLLPLQVVRLRRLLRRLGRPLIHAHSMYYIALARFSSCNYVATPQGSELLVRPYRSLAYRLFARIALSRASAITVDSHAMRESLAKLFRKTGHIVQNGIDTSAIAESAHTVPVRDKIVSMRGFAPNYRIDQLLDCRNRTMRDLPIHLCYPFVEATYKNAQSSKLLSADRDLGQLSRRQLYVLLATTKLAISIPESDSSPRSVYEAIFCGCFVAVSPGKWIEQLPPCMRSRLIVVNLNHGDWLREAVDYADANAATPFIPSGEALEQFDQARSMLRLYNVVYPAAVS